MIVALDENGKATEEMKVRELIALAEEDLRAVAGLHVSSKIAEGDWERVLIAGARRIGADCIFVSSGSSMNDHNPGRPGIVSAALLKGAPCSVEVVRQQQADINCPFVRGLSQCNNEKTYDRFSDRPRIGTDFNYHRE